MALNEKVADILNKQINKELYSAYLYLTFADYYEDRGLKGFANWYMIQVQEEVAGNAYFVQVFILLGLVVRLRRQIRKADDAVQRRPHIMADIR